MLRLVKVWSTQEDYGHGFFVLPIVFYMLWHKRGRLRAIPVQGSWVGLPVLLVGCLLYVVASIAKFHTLVYLCMILIIIGLLLFLAGWGWLRETAPQVALLLFMFPIPSALYVQITNPLKLAIADISTKIVQVMGIPVFREGNLLHLAGSKMEVTEACSGIRSLYSYLMLGCVFAFGGRTRLTRMVMILSAVPLAFLVNIVRVTGTTILSHVYGPEVAQGVFHMTAGFVLFAIGFAVFYVEYRLLNKEWFHERGATEIHDGP
jgi:exosortase